MRQAKTVMRKMSVRQQVEWETGLRDAKLCAETKDLSEAVDQLMCCWVLRHESCKLEGAPRDFIVALRLAIANEFRLCRGLRL